jgi:hypothetical protein
MHVSAVESIELDPFVGPRGVEFKVRISPALVLQESNRFLLGSSNSICVKHMVRTLSARSTTPSPHDHAIEIMAHRAHNAPRDACRGRPRPRPPQDQTVFRGRGSDANRIDCDGQSQCSGACEPGARFGPGARLARAEPCSERGADANRIDCAGRARSSGACEPAARFGLRARHARVRAAAAHDRLARGEPRRMDGQDLSRMLEAGGSARRRQSLCRAGAPQIQTRRIAAEAAEARQSAVRSGAKAAGKECVAGCQGMRPFANAGSISFLYEQWKTKTILFDPQVAAR